MAPNYAMERVERPGRCQCDPSCKKQTFTRSPFCEEHSALPVCPRKSPLSGWEPKYQPELWNQRQNRLTHNCFAYALNIIDPRQIIECLKTSTCNTSFPQPGLAAGNDNFKRENPKTCPEMIGRTLGDNPSIRPVKFEEKCPPETSKIALIVDEDEDYHYLRQDAGGWWSQKGGAKPITNLDAGGHFIWDPELADNNWTNNSGVLNYNISCGFFCVPRTKPLFMKTSGGGRRKGPTRKRKQRASAQHGKKSKTSRISQTKRSRGRKV
jgi:hypothetical protein